MDKANKLRDHLSRGNRARLIGVHNAVGAWIAEETGFEAVWASGLEISASYGIPDASIITSTEVIETACLINRATALPVVCDCDTGFGSVDTVIHLTKRLLDAGIAGMCIEDKVFPKMNSLVASGQRLANRDDSAAMIRAVKDTVGSTDFLVFARTEALMCGESIEEALTRTQMYAAAGADVVLINSKAPTPNELFQIARRRPHSVWMACLPTTFPQVTEIELQNHGFQIVIYANYGLRSIISSLRETFGAIAKSGTAADIDRRIAPVSTVMELVHFDNVWRHHEMYERYVRTLREQAKLPTEIVKIVKHG